MSFGSRWIPSIFIAGTGPSRNLGILTVACMLNFLGRRVKCISWYFSGANVAPCVHAQATHFSFALSKTQKAAQALSSVRGQPVESEYIRDELSVINVNYGYERSKTPQTSHIGSWAACFKGDIRSGSSNIRRTVVGMADYPVFC